MIIIDLAGVQASQQSLEMIHTMPIMPANRGTKHGRQFPRVIFVAQGIQ